VLRTTATSRAWPPKLLAVRRRIFWRIYFLGNPFSGLTDLGLDIFANRTPSGSEVATVLLSGGRQGIPGGGAGSQGALGVLQNAALAKMGGEAAVQGADVAGWAMLAYHFGTFVNGAANVCSDY
jgi:hypothetical protein